MLKTFLRTAFAFYGLAVISVIIAITYANRTNKSYDFGHETGITSGATGGATGFSIIASSLIITGSFFLYKYFTGKPNA
jgi:hypothetical protein